MTRIKEIKFEKKDALNKNDNKNNTKYMTTADNKSEVSESSLGSNKFDLKDIDNDIIFKKDKDLINNEQIKQSPIKRIKTNAGLPEKIQILTLAKNKDKPNIINPILDVKPEFNIKAQGNKKLCRICYGEEDDPKENPMVQPCHCSGSCKYIHLDCLKHWIMTKSCQKIDDNEFCCVYIFSETECELCKAKLPDLVSHKGKLYSLLDFSSDFKNYLILECLTLDKENNKFLYVISLEKKGEIKIGRGQICDILFSDASVSRIHCVFLVEGRNVYLKDTGSKFGTLVLIQTPIIKLAENLILSIQIGRSFLKFKVVTDENKFFKCCEVSEKPLAYYYYKQNMREINEKRTYTVKTDADIDADIIDEGKEENKSNKSDKDDKGDKSIKSDKNNNSNNEIEIIDENNGDINKRETIEEINIVK